MENDKQMFGGRFEIFTAMNILQIPLKPAEALMNSTESRGIGQTQSEDLLRESRASQKAAGNSIS